MDAALKFVLVVLVLALAGCFRTIVPHAPLHGEHETYQVRSGDTLGDIAKRYRLDYQKLASRNHLHPPYTIYTGQRLYLWNEAPKSSYLPMPKARKIKPHHKAKQVSKPHKKAHRASAYASRRGGVKLHWPVRGKVTSKFGRRHGRPHDGIDIGAKEGTPVHAAANGEVVYADRRLSGYGNLIIVRHSHDMFTAYAHNQRNLVRKGQRVAQGDVIARVGHTGRATGPHLHFEVRRGPTPVNPQAYLPRR
ncbi:MAG: M23 family metallopeptidase [Mariprofundaceae bacterium]|nr:M23 family metallopeptidase [Mariprofundaceae bacterium]